MAAIIDFKATKCRHCYKCVRNCEVKAIMVKDGRAEIMPENCVLCGKCLQICPQSAKTLISDLGKVKSYIARGEKVVVSIAPAYMGPRNTTFVSLPSSFFKSLPWAIMGDTTGAIYGINWG